MFFYHQCSNFSREYYNVFSLILILLFCIASLHALIKLLIKNFKIFFHHWLVGYKAIYDIWTLCIMGYGTPKKSLRNNIRNGANSTTLKHNVYCGRVWLTFYLRLVDNKNPILNNLIKYSNKLKMQENYWNRYHLVLSLHLEITLLPKPIFIYLLNKII